VDIVPAAGRAIVTISGKRLAAGPYSARCLYIIDFKEKKVLPKFWAKPEPDPRYGCVTPGFQNCHQVIHKLTHRNCG
jgi:hypothetical protein